MKPAGTSARPFRGVGFALVKFIAVRKILPIRQSMLTFELPQSRGKGSLWRTRMGNPDGANMAPEVIAPVIHHIAKEHETVKGRRIMARVDNHLLHHGWQRRPCKMRRPNKTMLDPIASLALMRINVDPFGRRTTTKAKRSATRRFFKRRNRLANHYGEARSRWPHSSANLCNAGATSTG